MAVREPASILRVKFQTRWQNNIKKRFIKYICRTTRQFTDYSTYRRAELRAVRKERSRHGPESSRLRSSREAIGRRWCADWRGCRRAISGEPRHLRMREFDCFRSPV